MHAYRLQVRIHAPCMQGALRNSRRKPASGPEGGIIITIITIIMVADMSFLSLTLDLRTGQCRMIPVQALQDGTASLPTR